MIHPVRKKILSQKVKFEKKSNFRFSNGVHAVILAGGWGRRFWPKSRRRFPKQFLSIGRGRSCLQNIFTILKSTIPKERIWVVTNQEYQKLLRKQLPSLAKRNILIEPLSRDTAIAVGLASAIIRKTDPEAVILSLSSDHIIGQKASFLKTLRDAANKAKETDALIAIGIRPNRPAIEYGYLKIAQSSEAKAQREKMFKVEKFIEKPKLKKAKTYLKSKNYFWNAGIFIWKAESILKEIKKYLPRLHSGLQRIEKAWGSSGYKRCLFNEYKKFKAISITYGIMEKSRNIYTVIGNFPWQDLGSWDNLAGKDSQGNVIQGLHQGIDTCNSVIIGEEDHLIATLGVSDLIIINTPDTTLICRKDQAQKVKQLSKDLEKNKQFKKYL